MRVFGYFLLTISVILSLGFLKIIPDGIYGIAKLVSLVLEQEGNYQSGYETGYLLGKTIMEILYIALVYLFWKLGNRLIKKKPNMV